MAIYHFSAQVASRSAGRSAVAMAAYRSGQRLEDERTGEMKFYRRASKPQTEIMAPVHSPEWIHDRNRLWNEVEKVEKRKDAQLCREINVALPKEFSTEMQTKMLRAFCQREFVDHGMIADVAIHRDDVNNPHAHIMLTMREVSPEGFGLKVREWNDRGLIEQWRENWAKDVNRIFEKANRSERIDHRSLEAQGIKDRVPTIHEGPTVRDMERKGKQTDRGSINRAVKEYNAVVYDLNAFSKKKEEIKGEMGRMPMSMKEVDQKHSELYKQRLEMSSDINKLQVQLQQIEKREEHLQKRDKIRNKIDELQPKNIIQRMRKTNEREIQVLNRSLEFLEKTISVDYRNTPPKTEVSKIQKEFFALQSTFKAIDRGFQEVSRQRSQMQQEERMRRMKAQAQSPQRDQDRGRER